LARELGNGLWRRMNVSVRTVENRRQRIFEKTETDSLAELIRLVVETGCTSAD